MRAMSTETMQNIISYVDQYFCDKHTTPSVNEIALGVGIPIYLHWLYLHKVTSQDYSLLLPNFKRSPVKLPQTWTAEEIERILAAIDTENPVGKRNYAMFLLMARTGLRISDVVSLKFSNIDWKSKAMP